MTKLPVGILSASQQITWNGSAADVQRALDIQVADADPGDHQDEGANVSNQPEARLLANIQDLASDQASPDVGRPAADIDRTEQPQLSCALAMLKQRMQRRRKARRIGLDSDQENLADASAFAAASLQVQA